MRFVRYILNHLNLKIGWVNSVRQQWKDYADKLGLLRKIDRGRIITVECNDELYVVFSPKNLNLKGIIVCNIGHIITSTKLYVHM